MAVCWFYMCVSLRIVDPMQTCKAYFLLKAALFPSILLEAKNQSHFKNKIICCFNSNSSDLDPKVVQGQFVMRSELVFAYAMHIL